jgi:hypothetical protein
MNIAKTRASALLTNLTHFPRVIMKRTRSFSSSSSAEYFTLEMLPIEMRMHMRTFLDDPVARIRLRCVSRFFHREDADFTLPSCLQPPGITKHVPLEFRNWALAWMRQYDGSCLRWIRDLKPPETRCHTSLWVSHVNGKENYENNEIHFSFETRGSHLPHPDVCLHKGRIIYQQQHPQWRIILSYCDECRWIRNDNTFIGCLTANATTLELLWSTRGTFISNALLLDQCSDMWLNTNMYKVIYYLFGDDDDDD